MNQRSILIRRLLLCVQIPALFLFFLASVGFAYFSISRYWNPAPIVSIGPTCLDDRIYRGAQIGWCLDTWTYSGGLGFVYKSFPNWETWKEPENREKWPKLLNFGGCGVPFLPEEPPYLFDFAQGFRWRREVPEIEYSDWRPYREMNESTEPLDPYDLKHLYSSNVYWLPASYRYTTETLVRLPGWIVFAALAIWPVIAIARLVRNRRRNRRLRLRGRCVRCGYDLTGNVSGFCTECGTPIEHFSDSTPFADSLEAPHRPTGRPS